MKRARPFFSAVYDRGEVFAVGNSYNDDSVRSAVERYDTLSMRSTLMVNRLPNDRANLSAAIFNNKLFIIGGIYRYANPDNAPAGWNEEEDGSYMTEVFCDDIYCS